VPTDRPEGLAETLRFEGVVELDVLTNNQLRPVLVEMATEKARFVPSVLVTARVWDVADTVAEDAPVAGCAVKVTVPGVPTGRAAVLTTSVTCIVWAAPLVGVTVMVPV